MNSLYKAVSVREVGAPVAAASTTDSNSDRIDMANYESVMFICPIEDSVATGVATLKVEQNIIDSDTGMAALSGASATATCTTNDDLNGQVLVVDVVKPVERYVQAVRTSATANVAFGTLIAVLYNPRTLPQSDSSTVLDSAVVTEPAEA